MSAVFGTTTFGNIIFANTLGESVLEGTIWFDRCPNENSWDNKLKALNTWSNQAIGISNWDDQDKDSANTIKCRK